MYKREEWIVFNEAFSIQVRPAGRGWRGLVKCFSRLVGASSGDSRGSSSDFRSFRRRLDGRVEGLLTANGGSWGSLEAAGPRGGGTVRNAGQLAKFLRTGVTQVSPAFPPGPQSVGCTSRETRNYAKVGSPSPGIVIAETAARAGAERRAPGNGVHGDGGGLPQLRHWNGSRTVITPEGMQEIPDHFSSAWHYSIVDG